MKTISPALSVRELAYIGLSAALITLCAWIAVPLPSNISFTMQTFAICAVAALLGWKRGLLTVLIYLLLGFVGLPVFSGFRSGAGVLLGATGGYLIGFLFMAPCIGLCAERFGRSVPVLLLSMVLGEVLLYLFGTIWFVAVYTGGVGFGGALIMCVVPYLLPDAVKIALAVMVVRRLAPHIQRNGGA